MGQPALFVENVLSQLQFPGHTLVADEQAAGFEVYHLANGRRAPGDRYQSVTANQARLVTGTYDRLRTITGLALDRGHNLAGVALSVLGSSDAWVSQHTVWSGTVPTVASPFMPLDNANGALTRDGDFVVRFPGDAAMAHRLSIPALGAGIVAQVVGAWLGMWYAPDFFDVPWGEEQTELMGTETQSPYGWVGATIGVPRRAGTLGIKLTSAGAYDLARYHLQGHFLNARRPMWIVMDDSQAERAVLARKVPGLQGFAFEPGWMAGRQARVGWIEHEPKLPGG
jgi:hypothetical protein